MEVSAYILDGGGAKERLARTHNILFGLCFMLAVLSANSLGYAAV